MRNKGSSRRTVSGLVVNPKLMLYDANGQCRYRELGELSASLYLHVRDDKNVPFCAGQPYGDGTLRYLLLTPNQTQFLKLCLAANESRHFIHARWQEIPPRQLPQYLWIWTRKYAVDMLSTDGGPIPVSSKGFSYQQEQKKQKNPLPPPEAYVQECIQAALHVLNTENLDPAFEKAWEEASPKTPE